MRFGQPNNFFLGGEGLQLRFGQSNNCVSLGEGLQLRFGQSNNFFFGGGVGVAQTHPFFYVGSGVYKTTTKYTPVYHTMGDRYQRTARMAVRRNTGLPTPRMTVHGGESAASHHGTSAASHHGTSDASHHGTVPTLVDSAAKIVDKMRLSVSQQALLLGEAMELQERAFRVKEAVEERAKHYAQVNNERGVRDPDSLATERQVHHMSTSARDAILAAAEWAQSVQMVSEIEAAYKNACDKLKVAEETYQRVRGGDTTPLEHGSGTAPSFATRVLL